MKIVIVGAGAMGCLFAGMLAPSGHDVLLIERISERAAAIRKSGICIERDGREMKIPMPAVYSNTTREAGIADLLLILVKSYATESAIQACLSVVGSGTTVLTLQNGLGNIETIGKYVPKSQILAGTTAQGATLLGNGRVRHAGWGETVIGALAPEEISRAEAVREVLQSCGIPTEVAADINSALWGKLLVNAGINALTAIMDIPNGRAGRDEHLRAVMRRAVLEGAEIAMRLSIVLPYADPVSRAEEVCRATAGNISSMLQDRRCGRRTEIESINGALEAYGRQFGIATPVNSCLACLVKALQPSAAS